MKNKNNSIESLKEEKLITTADKIEMPIGKVMFPKNKDIYEDLHSYMPTYIKEHLKRYPEWITEIEEYCSTAGILPSDLISSHRERNKPVIKLKSAKNNISMATEPAKPSKKNFRNDFRFKKTGISPKKLPPNCQDKEREMDDVCKYPIGTCEHCKNNF